jgi:hypothetical protein
MLAHLEGAHRLVQCEIFHKYKLSRLHLLYSNETMKVCDETELSARTARGLREDICNILEVKPCTRQIDLVNDHVVWHSPPERKSRHRRYRPGLRFEKPRE